MAYQLKMSDLANMTEAERATALGELTAAALAPRNGQAGALNARIRTYEQRYEMSSDELQLRLAAGTQDETAEIAEWLFLLDARDNRDRR